MRSIKGAAANGSVAIFLVAAWGVSGCEAGARNADPPSPASRPAAVVAPATSSVQSVAAAADRAGHHPACTGEGETPRAQSSCCTGLSPLNGYCVKNTNACLGSDVAAVGAACATGPSAACCQALAQFQARGCGCNAVVNALTGGALASLVDPTTGAPNSALAGACAAEFNVPVAACTFAHTYNGGQCAASDDQIDLARFGNISAFGALFNQLSDTPFDPTLPADQLEAQRQALYSAFVQGFGGIFEPDADDPYVLVPYGVGKYVGVTLMSEYLALGFPLLNAGAHRFAPAQPGGVLFFEQDGSIITGAQQRLEDQPQVSSATPPYYNGQSCTGTEGYGETMYGFTACNTQLHSLSVNGSQSQIPWQSSDPSKYTDIPNYVRQFTNDAQTKLWGPSTICAIHQAFCAGTAYQQYDSYAQCLAYIGKLPLTTKAFGARGAMGGDSLACRYKHSLMVRIDPATHCGHIGHNPTRTACIDEELLTPGVLGRGGDAINLDICDYPNELQCIEQVGGFYDPHQHCH